MHLLTPSFPTRRSSNLTTTRNSTRTVCPNEVRAVISGQVHHLGQHNLNQSNKTGGIGNQPTPIDHHALPTHNTTTHGMRSEAHTSELQSLKRISSDVLCLNKQINTTPTITTSRQ